MKTILFSAIPLSYLLCDCICENAESRSLVKKAIKVYVVCRG